MIEYALILLIVACICVGVVASIATTWSLRSKLFSLQDTVDRMEGTLLREVKARAGQERWRKPSAAEIAIETALQSPPPPPAKKKYNWWETGHARSVAK